MKSKFFKLFSFIFNNQLKNKVKSKTVYHHPHCPAYKWSIDEERPNLKNAIKITKSLIK